MGNSNLNSTFLSNAEIPHFSLGANQGQDFELYIFISAKKFS